MEVVSSCPLGAAAILWQQETGLWGLTVICKTTFQLEPGISRLTEIHEDLVEEDGYWDDDETRSLHTPSDLVPFKAHADVLLVGHAFAPGRQPVRALLARLLVGEVEKSIEVWCDRIFWQGGRLLEGPPFAKKQLRYERAAGGPGTSNPVGMRSDAPPDSYGAVRVPNLQPPGARVFRLGDTFAPIAFGPIAPSWPTRVEKLRGSGIAWSYPAWSTRPIPVDFDPAYFNAAPRDQQMRVIKADERIVLENLHPELPRLETCLPGVQPMARITLGRRAGELIALIADTLSIDSDRAICTVVWRGRLTLGHPEEAGMVEVSLERRSRTAPVMGWVSSDPSMAPLGWSDRDGERRPAGASNGTETLLGGMSRGAPLPFTPGPSRGNERSPSPEAPRRTESDGTGTLLGSFVSPQGALPFNVAEPSDVPLHPAAQGDVGAEGGQAATETIIGGLCGAPALPFAPASDPHPWEDFHTSLPDDYDRLRSDGTGTMFLMERPASHDLPFVGNRQRVVPSSDVPAPVELPPPAPVAPPPIVVLPGSPALQENHDEHLTFADDAATPPVSGAPASVELVVPDPVVPPPGAAGPVTSSARGPTLAVVAPAPPRPEMLDFRSIVVARLAAGQSLADLDLAGVTLDGIDFTGASLEHRSFAASSLIGCTFAKAHLAGADLTGADLSSSSFAGSSLEGADLTRANLERAQFSNARLSRATLSSCKGSGARFDHASLDGADLTQARLPEAVFDHATLVDLVANRADLTGASLKRAKLDGASLRAAKLRGAVFSHASVDGADLRDADLSGANVHGVALAVAKTSGAVMRGVVEIAISRSDTDSES